MRMQHHTGMQETSSKESELQRQSVLYSCQNRPELPSAMDWIGQRQARQLFRCSWCSLDGMAAVFLVCSGVHVTN